MTTFQIVSLVLFLILFIFFTVKIPSYGNEPYKAGQCVCFIVIWVFLLASTMINNNLQSKNPCPQLEKVENVYKIKNNGKEN